MIFIKTIDYVYRLFHLDKDLLIWLILLICTIIISGPICLRISSSVPQVKRRNVGREIFSEERAKDYLMNLTKYGSRVAHSQGNIHSRNYLLREIHRIFSTNQTNLQFNIDLQNFTSSSSYQLENILVRISNSTQTSKNMPSLLLTAHFDTGSKKNH